MKPLGQKKYLYLSETKGREKWRKCCLSTNQKVKFFQQRKKKEKKNMAVRKKVFFSSKSPFFFKRKIFFLIKQRTPSKNSYESLKSTKPLSFKVSTVPL